MAQAVLGQMETLFTKEVPRVADTFSAAIRDLEGRLDEATSEVRRLTETYADLQVSYEQLHERNRAEVARNEQLQQTHAEISRLNAENEHRLNELQRSWDEMDRQHTEDQMRISAVEAFVKAFPSRRDPSKP
ncbi:MAG: hypothetical protein WDA16_07305 [Candidatus Thermoplasmatota archaeon]